MVPGTDPQQPELIARVAEATAAHLRIMLHHPSFQAVEAAWRTSTVLALTRQAYETRDFGGLPVLADALEEAGCDDREWLMHLRGGGPHCRGCFMVDALLGKGWAVRSGSPG